MKNLRRVISMLVIVSMLISFFSVISYANEEQSCNQRYVGDIDGNGKINSIDLIILKRLILNDDISTAEEYFFADIDCNSKINAVDYLEIKHLLKYDKMNNPVAAAYTLDHHEEFLNFIENPSLLTLVKAEKARFIEKTYSSRADRIYYEYKDDKDEYLSETYTDMGTKVNKWYGILGLDPDILYLIYDRYELASYLEAQGIHDYDKIDNVFVIEIQSWVPPAIVVVLDGTYYFIELNMDIEYVYDHKYKYPMSTKLYTYEEYYEKYNGVDYIPINVGDSIIMSKYTAIRDRYSSYSDANLIPLLDILLALGANVEWNDSKTAVFIRFEGREYIIPSIEDIGLDVALIPNSVYEHLEDETYKHITGIGWGVPIYSQFVGDDFVCDAVYAANFINHIGYSIAIGEKEITVSKPH